MTDLKNKFANPNSAMVLITLINTPPRNRKRPRSANNADKLNETKARLVPINAETIICG